MRLKQAAPAAVIFTLALAAAAQTRAPGNRPPSVKLTASSSRVVLAAAECGASSACTPTKSTVQLSAAAADPEGDALRYAYSTNGGRVTGDGPEVVLDLTGVAPGAYKATVKVDDGRGGVAFDTAAVNVELCACSRPIHIPCPTVTVSCPDLGGPDGPVTFKAHVAGGDPGATPVYKWTVTGGNISSGQGASSVNVNKTDVADALTATVEVGGYDRSCPNSNSCTMMPGRPLTARKVDEYGGAVTLGDEKARLNNFAVELQNDPTAQGYLICYGGRRGRAGEARRRCGRARGYLVTARGIGAARVVAVDGGRREEPTTELWLVATGATPPTAAPTVITPETRKRPAATSRRSSRPPLTSPVR